MKRTLTLLLSLIISLLLQAQNKISLSGYIIDSQTGEALIAAGVTCRDAACISNSYGFYSIRIGAGTNRLSFSYVGYGTKEVEICAHSDTLINISLEPSETIAESVVTASAGNRVRSSYTGALSLSVKQITDSPALLGEADVLKVLQRTPGIQPGLEGFTGMYVRGGGSEENLQLYDGVPLYNVNHLLGLMSVFTPEAVKNVTFFKGSFPAEYGGRISSIIDVRTNDGNSEKHTGSVSIGLLSCKFHLDGPIKKGKTTYSVSARAMPTFLFNRLLVETAGYGYTFFDLNGKISHRFSDSDRLTLSLYRGRDKYMSKDSEESSSNTYVQEEKNYFSKKENVTSSLNYGWGNSMAALRWTHIFSPKIFSDFCLSWTDYESERIYHSKTAYSIEELNESWQFEKSASSRSGISDINAQASFEYTPDAHNLLSFGVQSTFHHFTPRSDYTATISSGYTDYDNISYKNNYSDQLDGIEAALYGEDNLSIGEKVNISLGLRSTLQHTQEKSYFVIEPRLSAQYVINNHLSVKTGYSRMSQYIHLLSTGMMSLPTDLWVPITKDIHPVVSDMLSAGLYGTFANGWSASLEAYWKRLHNVLEYKDGKASLSTTDWSDAVSSGEGLSKGVELFVEKKEGKTTGWLSYTLSKSVRWFPDGSINNGEVFPYTYDHRHNLNISIFHRISKAVDLSSSWTFYSGNMVTLPVRSAMVYDAYGYTDVPYVQSRNNFRLPSTHHLDLSANFRKEKKRGTRIWSLGIYNVYGRKNPNIIDQYDNMRVDDEGNFVPALVVNKVSILLFVPSISYKFSF